MARAISRPRPASTPAVDNGHEVEVLTLAEAARYLRLSEEEVLRMVREENLPARKVGTEWRFLKTALRLWLSQPLPSRPSGGIWATAGSWKDDPYLEELLTEIYRGRGRSMAEKD